MKVIKRDGSIHEFDIDKIKLAISKAINKTDFIDGVNDFEISECIEDITDRVKEDLKDFEQVPVEGIQDVVITNMFKFEIVNSALDYSKYRYEHEYLRMQESVLGIIDQSNRDVCDENSNKDASLSSTQMMLMGGEFSKNLTFNKLLPSHITKAHNDGLIHFHDADLFALLTHNCNLTNIQDMLDNGTVINKKKIVSPKSFETACNIMTQIVCSCCGGQDGGNSVSLMHLGKYLRRSIERINAKDMSDNQKIIDIKQCCKSGVQTILYQLNTFMTMQGQTPFITLFMHLPNNHEYYQELLMIYNELVDRIDEGMIDENYMNTTLAFPKLIYVTLDNNNVYSQSQGGELTRKVSRCSAKRMNPDIMSGKKLMEIHGAIYSTMGCRSLLDKWVDKYGKTKHEGRFNQGVVTLNLPRVALDCDGTFEGFYKLLEERALLCKEALMCRHERLLQATSDISPIHFQHGAIARLKPGESLRPLLVGGYSTISLGYIGVYETVKILTGESHTKRKDIALDIVKELKHYTEQWKKETNIGFGLYGTPSEKLTDTFVKKDIKKHGIIKDITDKGYYTNSYHVDVRERIGAFEKLKFESEFQEISTGGAISYIEIGDLSNNPLACYELVDFIHNNIVYAEFNAKFSSCAECGYEGVMYPDDKQQWSCPKCGCKDKSKLHVPRRSCGYVGSNFWSEGKTKEIGERVEHLNVPVGDHIIQYDTNNGQGLRTSVWFRGCSHRCVGCHNKHLWNKPCDFHIDIDKVIECCKVTGHLSVLGGEPLDGWNVKECDLLLKRVKREVPNCDIYMWSGYEYDEIKDLELMQYVDRITCGKFKLDLLCEGEEYGSSNQYHLYPKLNK